MLDHETLVTSATCDARASRVDFGHAATSTLLVLANVARLLAGRTIRTLVVFPRLATSLADPSRSPPLRSPRPTTAVMVRRPVQPRRSVAGHVTRIATPRSRASRAVLPRIRTHGMRFAHLTLTERLVETVAWT
jgi:hypothetical protein